jgi:hypothetical protein
MYVCVCVCVCVCVWITKYAPKQHRSDAGGGADAGGRGGRGQGIRADADRAALGPVHGQRGGQKEPQVSAPTHTHTRTHANNQTRTCAHAVTHRDRQQHQYLSQPTACCSPKPTNCLLFTSLQETGEQAHLHETHCDKVVRVRTGTHHADVPVCALNRYYTTRTRTLTVGAAERTLLLQERKQVHPLW